MLRMKHPRAIIPLFATEMWERFGFYIVSALLIIYMTRYLNFSDDKSFIILGEFSALVYISPLLGGFIADRILGYRYSILIGAVLLGTGYALLATTNHELLYWGLATVIMGNGFLKPNISTYLGEFYKPNDYRRDSGFTIFYMGINIGALLADASGGFIQEYFGWHVTFASAAIGMVVAIISFLAGINTFADYGLPVRREKMTPFIKKLANPLFIIAMFVIGIIVAYLMLKYAGIGGLIQNILGIVLLVGLIITALRYKEAVRKRMLLLIILIVISVFFWAMFFQLYSTVNLFVERAVERQLFGIKIPAIAFISFESIFILILGVPLAKLWQKLNYDQEHRPSISLKFGFAMLAIAAAMFILVLATDFPMQSGKIHASWMIEFYLLVTFGEMLLSPIGLSMVTELAPKHLTGLMMGIWFLALGFGGALAGYLARLASIPKGLHDIHAIVAIYAHAFRTYGIIALALGIIILIASPWLKRLQVMPQEES